MHDTNMQDPIPASLAPSVAAAFVAASSSIILVFSAVASSNAFFAAVEGGQSINISSEIGRMIQRLASYTVVKKDHDPVRPYLAAREKLHV